MDINSLQWNMEAIRLPKLRVMYQQFDQLIWWRGGVERQLWQMWGWRSGPERHLSLLLTLLDEHTTETNLGSPLQSFQRKDQVHCQTKSQNSHQQTAHITRSQSNVEDPKVRQVSSFHETEPTQGERAPQKGSSSDQKSILKLRDGCEPVEPQKETDSTKAGAPTSWIDS